MNPRALISLELTASRLLKSAVEAPSIALARNAINCTDGRDLFASFDLRPYVTPHMAKFEEIAVSAAIFGASRLVPAHQTLFTKGEGLARVFRGAQQMARMVGDGATARIRKHGLEALSANAIERGALIRKVESYCDCGRRTHLLKKAKSKNIRIAEGETSISDALNAATVGNARLVSDVAANLTTTRLAAYGFLAQAKKEGQDSFQISSELDDKVCAVCAYMHGKTFDTHKALKQTEDALDTEDPDDLEDIAPWPDQSRGGIEDLLSTDEDGMAKKGYQTPPFHPSCRCILVAPGDVDDAIPTMSEGKASSVTSGQGWLGRIQSIFEGKKEAINDD